MREKQHNKTLQWSRVNTSLLVICQQNDQNTKINMAHLLLSYCQTVLSPIASRALRNEYSISQTTMDHY